MPAINVAMELEIRPNDASTVDSTLSVTNRAR